MGSEEVEHTADRAFRVRGRRPPRQCGEFGSPGNQPRDQPVQELGITKNQALRRGGEDFLSWLSCRVARLADSP